ETVSEIFRRFQIRPEDLRQEIEADRVLVERIPATAEMPLSEDSKKVLAHAVHEAESLRDTAVRAEHLLLGVLSVEDGAAARVLAGHQLGVQRVREEVVALQPRPSRPAFERVIP